MTAEILDLHPLNPQKRLLDRIAKRLKDGAVIVYPTDSCYALGCHLGDKDAAERIRAIRKFDKHHLFTLVCRDLSDVGSYARVDNSQFRLLKSMTPGPYTFVLKASGEAPKRLLHEKRKTIGLRIPEHPMTQAILSALGEPLLSCTLILPPDLLPVSDPANVRSRLSGQVDVIIEAGDCGYEPTTVIDLTESEPRIIRKGKGEVHWLAPV